MVRKRIKIGFITYGLLGGGMEMFIFRLGGYLVKKGYSVDVITTEQPGLWVGYGAKYGLNMRDISKSKRYGDIIHSLIIAKKLIKSNYDIIFLNHSCHAQAIIGMFPENTGIIPILHNDLQGIYNVGLANKDAWNIAVAVSSKLYITAVEKVKDKPVIQINNGVRIPPKEVVYTENRKDNNPFYLSYIGRITHKAKGVLFLPDILHMLMERGVNVMLNIAGDGHDRDKLYTRMKEKGLLSRCRFLGILSENRIYDLLTKTHILLLPSFFEGLPTVLLESHACGCVPVCSFLKGVTDNVVEDGLSGYLVKPGDISGFVRAVQSLDKDRDKWMELSRKGYESASENFSLESMGAAYEKLIGEVLNNSYSLTKNRKMALPIEYDLFYIGSLWRILPFITRGLCFLRNMINHETFI